MSTKKFKVQYFHAPEKIKGALLSCLRGDLKETTGTDTGYLYIARVQSDNNVFCLNNARQKNIPHAGNNKAERKLILGADEGLVEKSYFAFDKESDVLVLQCNSHACRPDAFPKTVARLFRHQDTIIPVNDDRSIQAWDHVAALDLKIMSPKGEGASSPKIIESTPVLKGLHMIAEGLKADTTQTIGVNLSVGRQIRNKKDFLEGSVIRDIYDTFVCKKAMATLVDDDENGDPALFIVNLMGTLKTKSISVSMDDKYPNEPDIVAKLLECLGS